MKLRRATSGDAAAIRDLTRDVYAKWIPVIGREPKPMSADYDRAVHEHLIDMLEDGKGLVAVVEMIPADDWLMIENMAVRSDMQGSGIATSLIAHAEDVARRRNCRLLRLYTNAAFTANLGFYARRGFSETARTPLPDGGVMVHFAKTVS